MGERSDPVEEDYTLKCSFLDGDPVEHQIYGENDEGARIAKEIINVDVNAAYWKAIPEAFADG